MPETLQGCGHKQTFLPSLTLDKTVRVHQNYNSSSRNHPSVQIIKEMCSIAVEIFGDYWSGPEWWTSQR